MDPMTIGMIAGAGSSLLSAFMKNRSNKMAQRAARGYTPEEISTKGYDELYERVSGADFDRPMYQGYQNMMRGAASQAARIYSQLGNPALASDAAARERRSAQASLFEGLSQNNMQRLGMLANIEGARTGIQAQNVQARNAARVNELNLRVQSKMENPFAEAIGTIGGMAMGYLGQKSGQQFMAKQQAAEDLRMDQSSRMQQELLMRMFSRSSSPATMNAQVAPGITMSQQIQPESMQTSSNFPMSLRGSRFLPFSSGYRGMMDFQTSPLTYGRY